MAIDYVSMVENHEAQIQLTDLIKKSQICLFFNRLNVPKKLRGRGLGGLLLKSTLHYCHKNRIFLINTANNYGEMGQDNLINFYEKYGMKLVHEEGLLVFHCDFV